MSEISLKDVLKLGDAHSIRKEIRRSIFMIMFFGGILIALNYAKTNSREFLLASITAILTVTLFGVTTMIGVKRDKRVFLLFESVSLLTVSIIFAAICFTSYFIYLSFKSMIFVYLLILIDFIVAFVTYIVYRKMLKTRTRLKKGKVIGGSIFSLGASGYILGFILSKNFGQVDIHVAIIVLGFLVSCVCTMASSINLLKYRLLSGKEIV